MLGPCGRGAGFSMANPMPNLAAATNSKKVLSTKAVASLNCSFSCCVKLRRHQVAEAVGFH
eukprot:3855451-Amphidinium_carterae.5